MSGLENFEKSDSWRTKLMKLLQERNPIQSVNKPEPTKKDRYSLDLSEDLQAILEVKNIPHKFNNNSKMQHSNDEQENVSDIIKVVNFTVYRPADDGDDHDSDASFEIMEKMCNKTASDPNSTLFKYMHSENKEEIVADAKRSFNEMQTGDAETAALQRLLDELGTEEDSAIEEEYVKMRSEIEKSNSVGDTLREILNQLDENEHKILKSDDSKNFDITQLEDIEAPSHLWESTITGCDLICKTSPVKMVGLMRPSTIFEEYNEEYSNSTDVSSKMSFHTAAKDLPSEISSSCYDTANDSSMTFGLAQHKRSLGEEIAGKFENFEESINLINLDKTIAPIKDLMNFSTFQTPTPKVKLDNTDEKDISAEEDEIEEDMVINVDSSDDGDATGQRDYENLNVEVHIKTEKVSMNGMTTVDTTTDSVEQMYNTHNEMKEIKDEENEENKENVSSVDSDEVDDDDESMHFNDTLEQVEYMMKKGMELAKESAAKKATNTDSVSKKVCSKVNLEIPSLNLQSNLSPLKVLETKNRAQNRLFGTPSRGVLCEKLFDNAKVTHCSSSAKSTPRSATPKSLTPLSAINKNNQNFAVNIKPMPKFDVFKKPTSGIPTSTTMRNKNFPYVVSPVGAYVKQTATTPLMTSFKNKNKEANALNSTALRELEYESRLTKKQTDKKLSLSTLAPRSLPKKAYISSECKQIVDERSPITIPGGKKIQKYLENAMLPTVVRHDGKLKYDSSGSKSSEQGPQSNFNAPGSVSRIPKRTDHSLADLSLMSGDVSLYTLMDAKKF